MERHPLHVEWDAVTLQTNEIKLRFFFYRGQQINQKCCFQRWVYSRCLPKSTAAYGFSKFSQSWMLDKIFLPKPPCAGRRWGLPMRDYILCSHARMLGLAETHACSHSLCLSSHTYRQSHTLKWGGATFDLNGLWSRPFGSCWFLHVTDHKLCTAGRAHGNTSCLSSQTCFSSPHLYLLPLSIVPSYMYCRHTHVDSSSVGFFCACFQDQAGALSE